MAASAASGTAGATPVGTPMKTFVTSSPQMQGHSQIVSLQSLPQQFLQGGGQLVQNQNGLFQMIQPVQTISLDGQEALYVPAGFHAQQQQQQQQQQTQQQTTQQIAQNQQQQIVTQQQAIVSQQQQQQQTAAAANQQLQQLQQATFTIPGTNIQVPASTMTALNQLPGNITTIKLEGGKFPGCSSFNCSDRSFMEF